MRLVRRTFRTPRRFHRRFDSSASPPRTTRTTRTTGGIGAVATALATVGLLAACGASSPATSTNSSEPVSGGSLTYAIDTAPTCFDIHASSQDITAEIQRNVFDSLVAEDSHGEFHPWLATSWDISPDLRTYTFHLRKGVTFTDGSAFDATAVKLNFDHIVAKTTKSQYAASLIAGYTGTQVLDRYTARVTFSAPLAPFLQAASTAYLGFYSPKTLATAADKLCAGGPAAVGTGPFAFTSYTRGQSVVLTRNPAYNWAPPTAKHTGRAYLDSVTFRILPENSTRVGALTSGQVDLARAIPAANVRAVEADHSLSLLRADAGGGTYGLYLNTTLAPFTDERVRLAVQRGIDVGTDVATVYFGQYERAWSVLSPVTPSYSRSLEGRWPYDPARANALLDQAGWTGRDAQGYRTKDGKRLTIEWPAPPPELVREQRAILAQAIQADLKKIGIEVTHPTFDIGTYIDRFYAGKDQILDASWARYEPDILRLFFNSASDPAAGGENASYIKDPDIDAWTNAGASTLDAKVRDDDYAKVQRRVIDLGLVVPIYVPRALLGAATYVHGVAFDTNAWPTFYDGWRDKK